ncbi:hypothetical protein ACF0H5_021902 [Mactra antiquata]
MSKTPTNRRGNTLMQKIYELDSAYREIEAKDRELVKYKLTSKSEQSNRHEDDEKERELTKLRYMVSKLDERLQTAKVECENARRELLNEQESRKIVDKKMKALEKDNKDLRNKLSGVRAKLGVSTANHNVMKHDTEELKKTNQEHLIQIARLEERLAAANQDRERLRNPNNPDGSEEVKSRIVVENKQIKKLKAKLEKMKTEKEEDIKRMREMEEEYIKLSRDIELCHETISSLETSIQMAEMSIEAEKASREEFENQNRKLRSEKAGYDEQIKQYKVKLGISNASKNVNLRQAEVLRKKDEGYQFTIESLEKKLKMANAEIERLKTRYEMTGKTADSLQEHKGRLKRYRKTFGVEYKTIQQLDKPGVTGWSTNRTTPHDRISINSGGSVSSRQNVLPKLKINSGKGGRTSLP